MNSVAVNIDIFFDKCYNKYIILSIREKYNMNIKKSSDIKKGIFRKAAIIGLIVITILTGMVGLTGCNNATSPANKIESIFKKQKQSFELDYLGISLYEGKCIIDIVELPDENDFGSATAWGVYNSTEEFFNKIYAMAEKNPNGIKITKKEIKDPLAGTSSEQITINLYKNAIKSNSDIVELIYSEIKDKPIDFEDFEATSADK